MRQACKHLDFSWLSKGDSVFVKLSVNSGNLHPAVTSPEAVRGMVAELYKRGAGKVIVGDQAGVEHVRHVSSGKRFSSTSKLLVQNGLQKAINDAGAQAHLFDDQDYHKGWFPAKPPPGSAWKAIFLPNIIKQVDHIVYLPRLSSHAIAGNTIGHKIAVGWLRDDGRNIFHINGPNFYEMYTDVSYVKEIKDRLRLTLTLGEKVLLDFGPDLGTVYAADPRIVIASRRLVHHDALALGALVHMDSVVPCKSLLFYTPLKVDIYNKANFLLTETVTGMPWGPGKLLDIKSIKPHAFEKGISHDRCLKRGWQLSGGRPASVKVWVRGVQPNNALRSFLIKHGEGIFKFV